jgi:hypothetical protein
MARTEARRKERDGPRIAARKAEIQKRREKEDRLKIIRAEIRLENKLKQKIASERLRPLKEALKGLTGVERSRAYRRIYIKRPSVDLTRRIYRNTNSKSRIKKIERDRWRSVNQRAIIKALRDLGWVKGLQLVDPLRHENRSHHRDNWHPYNQKRRALFSALRQLGWINSSYEIVIQ